MHQGLDLALYEWKLATRGAASAALSATQLAPSVPSTTCMSSGGVQSLCTSLSTVCVSSAGSSGEVVGVGSSSAVSCAPTVRLVDMAFRILAASSSVEWGGSVMSCFTFLCLVRLPGKRGMT